MKFCPRCTTYKTENFFHSGRGYCKKCSREYLREWHRADPTRRKRYAARHAERDKQRYREWYRVNREKKLESHRIWVQQNADAIRVYVEGNRENYNEYARKRRSKTQNKIPVELLQGKMAYWGNRCWMCGGVFQHVDHVKPIAAGGPHLLANLRPACAPCNQRKNRAWSQPKNLRKWKQPSSS